MCGITGYYGYARQGEPEPESTLRRMVAEIAHRGPDQEGVHRSPAAHVGLGFRRLAIVDLSTAGHQPMTNADASVALVFNGEIYNHEEHRATLEARGHRFAGHSDTETLLKLYEEFGTECLDMIRGMFAFVLWDERVSRLWLVRDHLGVKPLYYSIGDGELIFGSEIKSLLAHPRVRRELDEEALSHYLTFMVPPAPRTLFAGVQKLPAAHYLTVDGSGRVDVVRYWAPTPAADVPSTTEEWAEAVRAKVSESVRLMLMSDVPYGAFLSGGLDSSAIVALMAHHSSKPVNTFSVGFRRYEEWNELDHARRVADRFGTDHHEIVIDDSDAVGYIPELVHTQDEPIGDPVCVPVHFLARQAREAGVPVVHIGEGADELFSGYPSYLARVRLERWWPALRRIPRRAWEAPIALATKLASAGSEKADRISRLLEYAADDDGRFWGNAIAFRGTAKHALLGGSFWAGRPPSESAVLVASFSPNGAVAPEALSPLQRIIWVELQQRLPELLLMRVDKLTMSSSIEARVPYLDHELVRLAMAMPDEVRVEGRSPKALLKRSLGPLVPREVVERPKQGFTVPVRDWFRQELRAEVRSVLTHSSIHEREYFDVGYITRLLDAHQDGGRDMATRLWVLYNLFHWYEHWIR